MPGQEVVMDENSPIESNPVEEKKEVKQEAQYAPIDKLEEQRQKLERIEKQLNGLSYIGRKFDEISRKFDSFQATPSQPVQQPQVPANEWDEKVQKNWKGTVEELADMRAEAKYKQLREQEKQEELRRSMLEHQRNILEENKRKVLEKYPDLIDQNSDTSQNYMAILRKHPEYLNNEFGPVLAMKDMEEEFKYEGKLDPQVKQVVQKEVQRQTRANASSAPTKGKAPSHSETSLSSEDIKLCRENGINQDLYLKMKKSMNLERMAEAS